MSSIEKFCSPLLDRTAGVPPHGPLTVIKKKQSENLDPAAAGSWAGPVAKVEVAKLLEGVISVSGEVGDWRGIPMTPALGRLSPEGATSFRSGQATERDFDSKSYSSQSSEQCVW